MILKAEHAQSVESYAESGYKTGGYRVAVPTYHRYDILRDRTLKTLARGNIDPELIDVFVADELEREAYESTLLKGTYKNIIVGKRGVKNIREIIHNHYKDKERVVSIDDDMTRVYIKGKDGTCYDCTNMDALFNYAFKICEEMCCTHWGVYAVDNPFYMKRQIACGLRFISGGLWGEIIDHRKNTIATMDDKDDYERSIKAYLADGSVVRLDYVGYTTQTYTLRGGMQYDGERTAERIEKNGLKLISMYPQLVHRNVKRTKRLEVILDDKRPGYAKLSKLKFKVK